MSLKLKETIAKLLGALTVKDVTPSTTDFITLNTGYSIQLLKVQQYGKVLALNFGVRYTSQMTAGSTYTVGTLKSAYRPIINSGGASPTFRELITTDGKVYLRPATNVVSGTWETFSIMYLLGGVLSNCIFKAFSRQLYSEGVAV